MAKLILFYYCWAHKTKAISSYEYTIFLAHKEQTIESYEKYYSHEYTPVLLS